MSDKVRQGKHVMMVRDGVLIALDLSRKERVIDSDGFFRLRAAAKEGGATTSL